MRLLRHFVPNVTLDLATIKTMISEIEGNTEAAATVVPAVETEESEVLQEELGCMIIDARGSYSLFNLFLLVPTSKTL
jgi:hypothetical protein